jgi:hypothetical protein
MILPFSVKIGPVGIQISNDSIGSNQLLGTSSDFEHTRKCWDELKNFIDSKLEEEFIRSKSVVTQNAKTKLAIEILNALSKQPIQKEQLMKELIKTGKFSKEQASEFLEEAIQKELIHPGQDGFYATNKILHSPST